MVSPGTPRFRFLAEDGSEVQVASVEELSTLLEEGALGPETSLFDAGTGRWARAGDVPIFQFVREELRAEGRLPQEEPEIVVLPDPPPVIPIDPVGDFDPIEHQEPGSLPPLAPPTVDPFEFHLPLSNPLDPLEGRPPEPQEVPPPAPLDLPPPAPLDSPPPVAPVSERLDAPPAELPVDEDSGNAEDEVPSEPWFEDRPLVLRAPEGQPTAGGPEVTPDGEGDAEREADEEEDTLEARLDRARSRHAVEDPDIDASPLHAWLTQGTPAPEALPTRAEPPVTEGASMPPDPAPGTPQDDAPLQIRTAWEDADDAPDPRAVWIAARRQRRNARIMAGVAVTLILIVGGAAIFAAGRTTGIGEGGAPESLARASGDAAEAGPAGFTALEGVELPADLERLAGLLWQDLPGQIDVLVDSIRMEAGLPDAPPRGWLSGRYLAEAGEFEDVAEFWEAYGSFVEELAVRDAELLAEAATRILEGRGRGATQSAFMASPEGDRDRLLAYVMDRQAIMRDARLDRYLHLGQTARAALELHAFLERNADAIAHAPAIGAGVSSDPVLEAVTETPEIRREMEQHLDRIFEALDRTRRGGQPSLAGLRVELFGSLGRPL